MQSQLRNKSRILFAVTLAISVLDFSDWGRLVSTGKLKLQWRVEVGLQAS